MKELAVKGGGGGGGGRLSSPLRFVHYKDLNEIIVILILSSNALALIFVICNQYCLRLHQKQSQMNKTFPERGA